MKTFVSSLCCAALLTGFAVGATQQLPAPPLDKNALLSPTVVLASVH